LLSAFAIAAETRELHGSANSRRLRNEDRRIPAVVYGGGEPAQSISVQEKNIVKSLENEAFYSHILTIDIAGNSQKAVLKAIHRHPSKAKILHIDFLRITGKEKITMKVPLHFHGEDVAPGIKENGGILARNMVDVDINCLPADLPEFIEVDVSTLELDKSIHLSDLKIPKGVEIVALTYGEEHDLPVVSIHLPRAAAAEEVEEEAPEAAEGEEGEEGEEAKADNNNSDKKSEK